MRALSEYLLVKSGAARFSDLGHSTDDGRPTEAKLLEYVMIDGLVSQATKDKGDKQR